MTDLEIISMINENDLHDCELVFRELYKTQYEMVENLVLSKYGTREDAKDIFQDSIISFYNSVKAQKFQRKCSVSTYLYSIARNLWHKKLKKNQRVVDVEDDVLLNLSSDAEILDCLEHSETQKMIGKLLVKLGSQCKRLLYYYYFEKLRMRKIADLLNYSSEQVAKNQKVKCMKKLRVFVMGSDFYKNQLDTKQ